MNLEKEFIPYEVALDMKSIGFDEPCICVYNDKNIYSVEQGDNSVLFKTVINSRLPNNFYASPTFSQCFRWFREKYGLVGIIKFGTQDFTYEIYNMGIMGDVSRIFDKVSLNFNGKYKEAELECLKKVIEIVKQK